MSADPGARPLGRRRRRRESDPRREFKVRLSEEEREQLRTRAQELGVAVGKLMVESALEGRETPAERRRAIAELFEVRRLLATVANNVNQLARTANISGDVGSQARLERTLADVKDLVVRLRQTTGARR